MVREIIKPPADEAKAAEFEASVGYIVALVEHGKPPTQIGVGNDRALCCQSAEQLAHATPGAEFGVFVAIKTVRCESEVVAT